MISWSVAERSGADRDRSSRESVLLEANVALTVGASSKPWTRSRRIARCEGDHRPWDRIHLQGARRVGLPTGRPLRSCSQESLPRTRLSIVSMAACATNA